MTLAMTSEASTINKSIQALTAPTQIGIITEIANAWSCKPALLLGAVWGGFVPIAVFVITHLEGISLRSPVAHWDALHYVVVAGLAFSATSVWSWGRTLYHGAKAAVFVALLEGTMILSHTASLSYAALGIIIVTNMMIVGARAAQVERAEPKNIEQQRITSREVKPETALTLRARHDHPRSLTRPVEDLLYTRAVELAQSGNCSINSLKRSLGIGWTRAAALGDRLEREGFPAKGGKRVPQTAASGTWQPNEPAQG